MTGPLSVDYISLKHASPWRAHVFRDYVLVRVAVEVDDVRLLRLDEDRRVRRRDDTHPFPVDELHQHLQDLTLVRNGESHLGLVEEKHRAVRERRESLFEEREHDLTVARHLQKLPDLRLVLEKSELVARIVYLGV